LVASAAFEELQWASVKSTIEQRACHCMWWLLGVVMQATVAAQGLLLWH
jgi:hypothetical protein